METMGTKASARGEESIPSDLFLSLLKSRAASNAPFFVYIMCFGGKEREGKGENKGILNLEGVSNSSEVSQDRVSSNHLV
jgi:hypothetical protein